MTFCFVHVTLWCVFFLFQQAYCIVVRFSLAFLKFVSNVESPNKMRAVCWCFLLGVLMGFFIITNISPPSPGEVVVSCLLCFLNTFFFFNCGCFFIFYYCFVCLCGVNLLL